MWSVMLAPPPAREDDGCDICTHFEEDRDGRARTCRLAADFRVAVHSVTSLSRDLSLIFTSQYLNHDTNSTSSN